MDRSLATGTGYAGQYRPAVAKEYESVARTPDELLLFFHHVPYTRLLQSGKTVIQHVYDAHYDGAEEVAGSNPRRRRMKGSIDPESAPHNTIPTSASPTVSATSSQCGP